MVSHPPVTGILPQPLECTLCGTEIPEHTAAHGHYDDHGELIGVAVSQGDTVVHSCGYEFEVPKLG